MWTDWTGGDQPEGMQDKRVEVRFKDGRTGKCKVNEVCWLHDKKLLNEHNFIVAYRLLDEAARILHIAGNVNMIPANLNADQLVRIFTKGDSYMNGKARIFDWSKTGDLNEIVGYRIIENLDDCKSVEITAATILTEMAETFAERNKIYGNNYRMVAPIVAILFPNGVPPELVTQHQWHLFELVLVKMSRFAFSGLTHQDSIRDMGVYCAMIEATLRNDKT